VREITREVAGYVCAAQSTYLAGLASNREPAVASSQPPLVNRQISGQNERLLTYSCADLPRTRSVLSNCSATPRTSVPAASQRRGYVNPANSRSSPEIENSLSRIRKFTHANFEQLGTFGRAKRKVEEMSNVIAESRRAGHGH
jgi:hypothetical protein